MPTNATLLSRKFSVLEGLELAADWTGPVEGPLVVLSHGGGLTRRSWRATVPSLAANGYEAVAIDMRGHGESQWSSKRDYSLQAYAADIHAVAREAGAGRDVHLVGASLGGLASLIASTSLPGLRSLVLVDVVPEVDRSRARAIEQFIRANLDGFAGIEEAAKAVSEFQGRPYPSENFENLRHSLREGIDKRLYWHWDPARLRETHQFDAYDIASLNCAARGLQAPLLLLRGELSTMISDDGVEALRREAPQLQVQQVIDAGHNIADGNFQGFLQALLAFLGSVRSNAPFCGPDGTAADVPTMNDTGSTAARSVK